MEVERIMTRFGATKFASGWDQKGATVLFEFQERRVRFVLPLPSRDEKNYDQTCRSRWRSLVLCIKAKLEAIESGISDFESEFLSFIVLPGGDTVGEAVGPLLVKAYQTGIMPPLMLGAGS